MDSSAPIQPEPWLAHAGWMRTLARRLLADPADVDDVVQDASIAAWRQTESMAPQPRALEPWLARVVRNLARSRQRSRERRDAHEGARSPLAALPTAEQILERLDLQRILVEEVRALEEPLRSTIVLRFFEERTSASIAEASGIPEGTVRWRVKRALAELRARLDRRLGGRDVWSAMLLPIALFPALPGPGAASTARGPGTDLMPTQGALLATGTQGVLLMSAIAKIAAAAGLLTAVGAVWWSFQEPAPEAHPNPEIARAEPAAKLVETPLVGEAIPAGTRELSASHGVEPIAAAPAAVVNPPDFPAPFPPARVVARFVDAAGGAWPDVRFESRDSSLATTSSADGRAELEIPWTWPAEEELVPASFVARRAGAAIKTLHASLSPGATTDLGDVLLGPGARILGRVVDVSGVLESGPAIVGLCAVEIPADDPGRLARQGSEAFDPVVSTMTEPGGNFVLEGVAAGRWRLWANAEGARFAWTEPFDVLEGRDTSGIEIPLPALFVEDRIGGIVLDPKGAPFPGADLTFAYSSGHESGSYTGSSDEQGRFEFLIQLEALYSILARDPLDRFDTALASGVRPGSLDLVIRLGEKSFLDVRVKSPEDLPVEEASFEVLMRTDGASIGEGSKVKTSAPGAYLLPTPPMRFELSVSAPGFRPRTIDSLDPASLAQPLVIVLEPARRLRGRVVFEGEPVSNARVLLRERLRGSSVHWNGFECLVEPEVLSEVDCDAAGRFEIPCEVDSEVVLRAIAPGLAPGELEPLDPTRTHEDLRIELTRGGALEGRVIVTEGHSAEGSIVGINRGDLAPRTMRVGPDGRFRFEGLTPGSWQVLARDEELEPGGVTISRNTDDGSTEPPEIRWSCEVQAGRTTVYDLDLRER